MDPGSNAGNYRPGVSASAHEPARADEPVHHYMMPGYTTRSSYGCHRPQWQQQFPTGYATAHAFGGEKRSATFSPSSPEGVRHRSTIEPISRKIAPLTPTSIDTFSCLKLASQASPKPSSTLEDESGRHPGSSICRDYVMDDTSTSKAKLSKHDSSRNLPPPGRRISDSNMKNLASTDTVRYGAGPTRLINDDCSASYLADDDSAYTEGMASLATNPRVIAIGILADAPPPDPQVQQDQAMLSQLVANDLAEKEHNLKMQRQEAAIVERRLLNSRIAASIAKRDSRVSSLAMNFEPRRSSIDSLKKTSVRRSISKLPGDTTTKFSHAKSMSSDNEAPSSESQALQITPRMRSRKSANLDRQEKIRTARASMTRVHDPPKSYSIPSSTPPKLPIRKHSGSETHMSDDFSVDAPTEGGGDITTAGSSACSVVTSSSGIDLDDLTREKIIASSASMHMARRQQSLLATEARVEARKGSIHSKESITSLSDYPKKTVRTLSGTSSTSSSHSRRSSRREKSALRVSLTESFNSKTKEELLLVTGNQEIHEVGDGLPFGPVMSLDFANNGDKEDDQVERLDMEAQIGAPLILPGAFAVRPIDASRSMHSSGYDSGFEEDSVKSTEDQPEALGSSSTEVIPPRRPHLRPVVTNDPVQAELYHVDYADAQVVEAGVDSDNKSSRKRTRLLFAAVLFIVIAVATGITISVLFTGEGNDPECQEGCVPTTIQGWKQVGELLMGPTNSDSIRFGYSVAMSGDGNRVAIGLPGLDISDDDDETISQAGSVMIWDFNGTAWTTVAELRGLEAGGNAGSAVVMSQDGNRVAFGAPNTKGGGYVAMFEETPNGTWELVCDLLNASNLSGSTAFGMSLSISADGNILAVGDRYANMNGNRTSVGAIRIYQQGNVTWDQLGEEIQGQDANDFFGWSVALSEDGQRVAASAVGKDNLKGEVSVFDFEDGAWVRVGSNLVGQIERETFGASLALGNNGDVLAIGASGYSRSGSGVGRLLMYKYDAQTKDWTPMGDPIEGDRQFDRFGTSVALSAKGDVLAIGSPENDDFGNNAGFIAIMQYDGTSWTRVGSKLGRQDSEGGLFAFSIAMSTDGQRVVGGAPELTFDGKFSKVGRAWVYDRGDIV